MNVFANLQNSGTDIENCIVKKTKNDNYSYSQIAAILKMAAILKNTYIYTYMLAYIQGMFVPIYRTVALI